MTQTSVKGKPQRVVAVTGGSGQLGTHLLSRLVATPGIERVISIDVRPPLVASDRLHTITADIRDPMLSQYFEAADAVIHCAFLINGFESTPLYRSVNIEGSENVVRSAIAAGVDTIVVLSSITAYGCVPGHPVPILETTPRVHQPDFPYASCKFEVEAFLDELEPKYPNVAISRIRANILLGRKMPHLLGTMFRIGWIPDLGGTPLPIVWDEDVADLILRAMHGRAKGAFNAAADDLLPSPELAEQTGTRSVRGWKILMLGYRALNRILRALNIQLLADPSWKTKTEGAMLIASSARAKNELGWSPRYPTAVAVVKRFQEVAPWILDLRLLMGLWLLSLCVPRSPDMLSGRSGRVSLRLNGPVGGDFSIFVVDGRFKARPGPLPAPTSTIVMSAELFRRLLAGDVMLDDIRAVGQIELQGATADWELFRWFVGLPSAIRAKGGMRGIAARVFSWLL